MSEEKKLGQDPAFPIIENCANIGTTRRFYAACAAMTGMLSNSDLIKASTVVAIENKILTEKWLVQCVYNIADELLKQENE